MSALSQYDNRSPRERFWSSPQTWPGDTPDHEFVGRLILRAGAIMAGTEWNDLDPAVHIPKPISEDLSIYTPMTQIHQAADALTMGDRPYGDRQPTGLMGGPFDIPSKAEWSIARKIIANQISVAQAKYYRFWRACEAVENAFKTGVLKSATREFAGGDLTAQPWHFWNTEFAWSRFETCRVNPNDYFDPAPAENGALWIFVERDKATDKIPEAISQSTQATDGEIAEIVKRKPRRAGRKPTYNWDELFAELFRKQRASEIPTEPNISELAWRLLDWAAERWENLPEEKTVQDKLRVLLCLEEV